MKNKEKYDFTNIYFEINKSFDGKPVWNIYCNKRYVGTVDRDGVSRTQAILKWLESDVLIPSILDDKEREFLQYIYDHIRPEILTFSKAHMADNIHESIIIRSANYSCNFLPFKVNEMYRGMETYRRYTPEELGLKKRKAAFRLEDYKGKFCMHCNTEEKARTFFTLLDKNGRRWASGDRYTERNKVLNYGENTCVFFNEGLIGYVNFAIDYKFEVLEFDDFEWEKLK